MTRSDTSTARVFHLRASALPLPESAGLTTIAAPLEVGLQGPPSSDGSFLIRAACDALPSGTYVALRYLDRGGARLALARMHGPVRRAGLAFELVMATLVVPAADAPSRRAARVGVSHGCRVRVIDASGAPLAPQGEIAVTIVDVSESGIAVESQAELSEGQRLRVTSTDRAALAEAELVVVRRDAATGRIGARFVDVAQGGRAFRSFSADLLPADAREGASPRRRQPGEDGFRVAGSASAVVVGGVPTIGAQTAVQLLTPPEAHARVHVAATRDSIPRGACFAVRYFDRAGAKRVLIRAVAVRAEPGMLDQVEGIVLRPPEAAPERASYRAPFERRFTARLTSLELVGGRLLDLSAQGVGLRLPAPLGSGAILRISDPDLPELDGAELAVVRRGPHDANRYGARFVRPEHGRIAFASVLDDAAAERARRRHVATHTRSQASATAITPEDASRLRRQRMRTREHRAERPADP